MEFKLRPWKLDDLKDLVNYANNRKIAANLTDLFPHPYCEEDGSKFIKMTLKQSPTQVFAIEINQKASGSIGLHPQTDVHGKNMELGYWLAEDYWDKGLMTAAVQQITLYGFKTFDVNRIYARPFGTNIGSQKVLEKAGFKLEGRFNNAIFKNGIYLDEMIYALPKI